MRTVLLIHQEQILHYRVPVYNYLSAYLKKQQCTLRVMSGAIQEGNPHPVQFDFCKTPMTMADIARRLIEEKPDVVIFWVDYKYLYLFPVLLLTKLLGLKAINWGHGTDLTRTRSGLQRMANAIQYTLDDAIILYGEAVKKHVPPRFHHKVFIANNTLHFGRDVVSNPDKGAILAKFGIRTRRNIICVGRMERRKRLEDLAAAHRMLQRDDIGLILVGPDNDGVLKGFSGDNVYKLGAIYGDEKFELLSAADVYCLPGWVGLSIVDAFYCGLPFVTEEGENAPEIMYLKDGVNGFVVPAGDVKELAGKLLLLLDNDAMRGRFSLEARREIMTNGSIDKMCQGFGDAIRFVSGTGSSGSDTIAGMAR